ncbi:2OG-Fe(II) oxygenase superfamily protein [Xylariomycetidae sp. FL0641]|nr:2OG-Fe(II) oxygenase superfamily protein [Xylariomycetidae sp. FL0641]
MANATTIPIIDLSTEGSDQAKLAHDLVDAAVNCGFVYIKNAGQVISVEQVQRAFDLSRTLFRSPTEDKQRCKIQKNNQGWSGMHTETLDPKTQRVGDFKEAFNFGPFDDGRATQPIPRSIEPHQAELAAFRGACHYLCRRILHLFGIGLGVEPPDFFAQAHSPEKPSGSILRFLYYPPPSATDAQDDDVRAGAHSDYGSVTLLFRLKGQAGLEILTPDTNSWAPVPVCPQGTEDDDAPPILVNIGDLLSYWTNGLFRSTVHRVTNGTKGTSAGLVSGESTADARYSIVFFCHPAHETPLLSVPSERVWSFNGGQTSSAGDRNPYDQRKVLTADEHLQMRLQASYLQLYAEKAQ